MTDDLTAQKILQDWATRRGFATTLTVDTDGKAAGERLYFHFDKFSGFAFLNFRKSPMLTLVVSNNNDRSAMSAWLVGQPDYGFGFGGMPNNSSLKKQYSEYELSLADAKVFTQIERILERTIDSYLEG